MKIPGVRVIVPVLVGTLFAACSPTHMVTRSVTATDLAGVQHVVVDDQLYYTKGVRGDTLVCMRRTQPSPNGDGTRVPLTVQEARLAGMKDDDLLQLSFRPDAVMHASGDTLLIPLQSIGTVTRSETNPAFVVGTVVIAASVVLVGVATYKLGESMNRALIGTFSLLGGL